VATVTEPDETINEHHLNAVIELLETTLSITDDQETEEQIQLQLELLYINKEII